VCSLNSTSLSKLWRIRPLRLMSLLSLFLSCSLISQQTLAANPSPVTVNQQVDLRCLTIPQQVKIETCFEQNASCQSNLAKANTPPPDPTTFEKIALWVGAGLIAGFVAAKTIH
jgi:hypothetical protein